MEDWSLSEVLTGVQDNIRQRLVTTRKTIAHPGSKGSAAEHAWLELLATYLPQRYQVASAHVVDSRGAVSQQIDVVVFDRQYSPFIFHHESHCIVPAEGVYAVFEAKQSLNSKVVRYAQKKVSSVRRLYRTSLPIPHAGGTYPAKPLPYILGGVLTLESDWNPALGQPLLDILGEAEPEGRLDIGCVVAHGTFTCDKDGRCKVMPETRAGTAFLFELIAVLQSSATVPMIDVRAYAKLLAK